MRRLLVSAPTLLLVLLAGCAATPQEQSRMATEHAREEAKIAVALKGLQPGKPRDCIEPRDATSTEVHGDTILYRTGRQLIYRTDTGGGCFGLSRDDIIVTVSTTGQLCRGDIVRTIDRSSRMPSGSCSFGDFTPYSKPKN